jgi:DNA-binding winged helix-turn-helix (wHTH) protein
VLYRFDEFELDAAAYTLTRRGMELPLQPKVFDLMRCLLDRRGQVVTKAELLDVVWAGEHVNEGAVPWTVFHARRALGQGRGAKTPIETVLGRGYRFASNVEVVPGARASGRVPPRSVSAPPPSVAGGSLPFVGRSDAMDRLEGRLEQALCGEGGICLLVGEAGIGKTRCAEELRGHAAERGVQTWCGRSVEGLGAPVFWPWIQVLRDALRDRSELLEPGEALLSRMAALDAKQMAPRPRTGRRNGGDRFWVLDGVSDLLLRASRQQPFMVLLEDLHWADSATLELLAFLAPLLQRSTLLVLGTLRNEVRVTDRRATANLLHGVERIELEHLTRDDVSRYIAELTHQTPSIPLCRAVHRATAGNPLFLQETVRSLIVEHGADELATLEPGVIGPPRVARDVLRSRLAALDEDVLSVLASASVLGASFEVAILQRLRDSSDSLLESLERARASGLILTDGPHRYRFAHELLRSILYDDIPGSERVATHRRAAELLSELGRTERRHSQIAHHFYRSLPAGEYERVVAAAVQAAEAAARMHAFEDAATFYGWALEAQGLDPKTQTRERAQLLCASGTTERLAGRAEDSRRTLSLVVEIGRQHGYGDLLLRAARMLRPSHVLGGVPDPLVRTTLEEVLRVSPDGPNPHRISALSQLACVPPYSLDMQRSAELSEEAVALARQLGDSLRLLEALRARLHSLSGPDHIDDVIAVSDEMLELNERGRWMNGEAHMARMCALLYRGDLPAADAELQAVLREAQAVQLPEAIWMHDRIRNQRRIADGEFAAAEAACKDLAGRGKRMGLGYWRTFLGEQRMAIALARHGVEAARQWDLNALVHYASDVEQSYAAGFVALTAELGREREAQRMLDHMAARRFEDLAKDIGYVNALSHLGDAAVLLRDRPRAEQLYALLLPYALLNTPNSLSSYNGSASASLARLAALLGWDDRAEEHFVAALEMNDRLGVRPQVARVSYDYARWLAERQRPGRARGEAQRAAKLAGELGMGWLEARATELAD